MGDIIMTTPIVRCLSEQKKAEIHFVTKSIYADLLNLPQIYKLHCFHSDIKEVLEELKSIKFNYIIDLHNNLRSRKLCLLLHGRVLRTKKMAIRKWIYLMLGIDLLKKEHVIKRHFDGILKIGITDDGQGMMVPRSQSTVAINHSHIAVVMGGSYVTKRIPLQLIIELIQFLPHFTFHILGGQDVSEHADHFANKENVINHIASTDINQSIQILERCQLVITGDTGLMHMAAALQKQLIVIWGSTSETFGFAPFYGFQSQLEHINIELLDLACRPCSKYGKVACPKGHMHCLNKISSNQLISAINACKSKNY